ncbi:MAG: hypothetical protein WCG97_03685 [bacterium]
MKPESIEISHQEKLKLKLLSGEITPGAFLDEIEKIDQSTLDRKNSFENIKVLEDAEVREKFKGSDVVFLYENLLSLTYFHIGQNEALEGQVGALSHFQSALEAAKKALEVSGEVVGYDSEWVYYVRATVSYLRKDLAELESCLPKITSRKNMLVVINLIDGLKKRGEIDYKTDYHI